MQIKDEALRYLGYSGQDLEPMLNNIIDNCLQEAEELADVRHALQRFQLKHRAEVYIVPHEVILSGQAIKYHLRNSTECIFMGVTLGANLDRKIRYYQYKDLTHATILDACATALIEAECDRIAREYAKQNLTDELALTSRFSPGYGDFPLSMQPIILSLLNAQNKIGLTVTKYNLLIPRKSVTAVIGVQKKCKFVQRNKCFDCSLSDCPYKKL